MNDKLDLFTYFFCIMRDHLNQPQQDYSDQLYIIIYQEINLDQL